MKPEEAPGQTIKTAPFLTVGGFLYKTARTIPSHPYGNYLSGNSFPMDFICPSDQYEAS